LHVSLGEITVYCGEDAMANTRAAFKKSLEMIKSNCFKKIMVVNSGPEQRRVLAEARNISPNGKISDSITNSDVYVYASRMGELSKEIHWIEDMLRRHKFDALVINSWEFASANSRYKEALLFALRGLASEMGMAIIIYSQMTAVEYRPGRIMRGSLGKLSAIAWNIFPVLEEIEPLAEEKSEKFITPSGKLDPIRSVEHEGMIPKAREKMLENELLEA
ncbi:MAG: hypothetical protein ACHQM6_09415, partial [Candidatus Kapaibacterium sp.]